MNEEIEAQSQQEHSTAQSHHRSPARGAGFYFGVLDETQEAENEQSQSRWYHNIGGWVCRRWEAFIRLLRRYSTLIIMLATLVNLGVAYLQWSTMIEETKANQRSAKAAEDQLTEMKGSSEDTRAVARAAEQSAATADKSVVIAQQNADIAEKALALSIRPQLTVERIFDLVLVPRRGVEVKLELVNRGNGSAQSPSSTILFGTCPREVGGECFDACPTKTDPKRMIPGSWANVDPKMSVIRVYQDYSLTSAEEIESITTGTRLLYVCGIHSYTDLVSNPYDSFFCFGYDGSVKRWAGCGIGPQNKEKENTK